MSALDFRSIEKVTCAGLRISTFLNEDRSRIMVSASDLVETLGLDVDVSGLTEYAAYGRDGKRRLHRCIEHTDINEFLWMNVCIEDQVDNLDEFRRFFMYEVVTLWNRLGPSAASLSIRDAVDLIDRKVVVLSEDAGIPPGRIYYMALESLGYKEMPIKEDITTEEYSFIVFSKLMYVIIADSEQAWGSNPREAIALADKKISDALMRIGYTIREAVINN